MFRRALITLLCALTLIGVPSALAASSAQGPMLHPLAAVRQASTQAYTPDQIQTAYDVTPLIDRGIDGTGQTIALIEFDKYAPSDLQDFDTASGLPDPTVQEYYPTGQTFTPSDSPETSMDLEWAHALAPGATIQIYYLPDTQVSTAAWQDVATAVNAAVAHGAGTISMSFGACNPGRGYQAAQAALKRALQSGIGIFVSSGDSGPYPGPKRDCGPTTGVAYPASDPSVVSVGGTSLVLNHDNTINSETAWRLSGGGKGSPLLRPLWQITSALRPGKFRYAPDVAFLGDSTTGVEVRYNGRWHKAAGTSLGAPAWAGIWTLMRQDAAQSGKSLGPAPSVIYQIGNSSSYTQAFHDITQGGNWKYHAGPGWDAVTGWGTPDVNQLAAIGQTIVARS